MKELQVKNLALVENARVGFGPGLNLLTGETGSGKSLIVDALGLSMGARASSEQVRQGADRAVVEALFDISDVPPARALLQGLGHDPGPDLVLSREVGRRGGARLNGRPATPGQLRELARVLVGIHGQHEYQTLLDPDAQTLLLDVHSGATAVREAVGRAHAEWTQVAGRLAGLEQMQARGRREEEYLRWQLDELEAAALRAGEDGELAAERQVARHAARLAELASTALEALRADEGVGAAASSVRAAAELDPRLEVVAGRLGAIEEELAEVGAELRRYGESMDPDPGRLESMEERLSLLDGIKRKYGGSLDLALAERDRLRLQLGQTADLGAAIERGQTEVAEARLQLEAAAASLSAERVRSADSMGGAVSRELYGLRLEGARFEVHLASRPEIAAEGAEVAEMMFSANPGEPLAALAKVASGGELARVMLAVKTVGAESDRLPTLVFDEVDAGIGGEAAIQVGLRLKALGSRRQVLVVTHLAQIACFADHHLVVEKTAGPDGRNLVRVRELAGESERAAELARMMSGGVTEKALARARELMDEARA